MEEMKAFFTARVDLYDEHMINEVEGCREAYGKMAELVPAGAETLLDLGCGTGLELEGIFKKYPGISVTGIDLTQAMLDKMQEKYPDKKLRAICGSYFDIPFETGGFDCAVSFQTMHHFTHSVKAGLYRKVWNALKDGGVYIECDYMVERQQEEDFYFAEYERLRRELNLPDNGFYHYDTPCTIENQIKLLKKAGFSGVEKVYRVGNTTILVAHK